MSDSTRHGERAATVSTRALAGACGLILLAACGSKGGSSGTGGASGTTTAATGATTTAGGTTTGTGGTTTAGGTTTGTTAATTTTSTGGGTAAATKVITGQKNPGGIAVNADHLVWTTCTTAAGNLNCTGDIMNMAPSGTTASALASNVDNGGLVTIDGTSAYWAEPDNNIVKKVDFATGTQTKLTNDLDNSPLEVVVDSASAYWSDGTSVWKVALTASAAAPTLLASPANLSDVYQQTNIAVNASGVFATTSTTIVRIPLAGKSSPAVASNQSPSAIASDATNIYWINSGNGAPTIMKMAAAGTAQPVPLATLALTDAPEYLTVDDMNVYWIEGAGSVKSIPIAGASSPTVLAAAPETPGGIAVDATYVYWTDTAGGTIYKIAK